MHYQSTYVWQDKRALSAAYTGTNSLLPQQESGYTLTGTLFLGARLWRGAEFYWNPELSQSSEISDLKGLGGLTNGENQKGGASTAQVYQARWFLRQTWGFGGEKTRVDAAVNNQLAGTVDSRRVVLSVGKMSIMDIFDNNEVSHDPRTQFLNWTFLTYGAYDYAADTKGYTRGLALEGDYDSWALRMARFQQPSESNGPSLDGDLREHFGDQVELEHAHTWYGQGGKVRLLAFRNVAVMGAFEEALDYARVHGGTPDVGLVRRRQSKWGLGAGLEQNLSPTAACFVRACWNDGHTETFAFTEIERSVSAGATVRGTAWKRPDDVVGLAVAQNGISSEHQQDVAAGGLGAFIGDGRLNYRPERLLEAYYAFRGSQNIWLSTDFQFIRNPAYNADRGPVKVYGFRMHVEF